MRVTRVAAGRVSYADDLLVVIIKLIELPDGKALASNPYRSV
jgi:hypothetical protein